MKWRGQIACFWMALDVNAPRPKQIPQVTWELMIEFFTVWLEILGCENAN